MQRLILSILLLLLFFGVSQSPFLTLRVYGEGEELSQLCFFADRIRPITLDAGVTSPLCSYFISLEDIFRTFKGSTNWDLGDQILRFWLTHIRPYLSAYLYWLFRNSIYQGDLPEVWVLYRDLGKEEFGELLAEYPFRMDFGGGLFDFSPKEVDFFFLERKWNRDCDNWARMWFWWAEYHGYPAWEIAIMDGWDITTAHMITVFLDDEGYNLCNYTIVGQYSSLQEAVEEFKRKRLTKSGVYHQLRWVIYQSIP